LAWTWASKKTKTQISEGQCHQQNDQQAKDEFPTVFRHSLLSEAKAKMTISIPFCYADFPILKDNALSL